MVLVLLLFMKLKELLGALYQDNFFYSLTWGLHSHYLIISQRLYFLIQSYWALRFQHMNSGGTQTFRAWKWAQLKHISRTTFFLKAVGGNGVNNWSYLHDEASVKISKEWVWIASSLVNRWRYWEFCVSREGMELLHNLPYISPSSGCSSISFIMSFYNKPVNSEWTVFLSSVSLSSKLTTQGSI